MQLRFIFFTILLISCSSLHAQTAVIQGRLTSDLNGKYQLNNIPPGKYTLIASFVGHISEKRSIELRAGQTLIANFQLISSSTL